AVTTAGNPAATLRRQRGTSLMHRAAGASRVTKLRLNSPSKTESRQGERIFVARRLRSGRKLRQLLKPKTCLDRTDIGFRRCLRNDGELRGLHLEGFELTGATLRILCRHRIPHDPHRRIVGHHPFSDPEFPFRLPFVLSIAHRHIDRLASVGQVNDELRCAVALAGGWIERVYPEPDRLAALELIVQETIADVARGIEVDVVAKEDQPIAAGRIGERRWGERRDQDERRALAQVFHELTVTESPWQSKRKELSARMAAKTASKAE